MVYTKMVATKIAGYGAAKMEAQGYVLEPMKNCEGGFYIIKPASDDQAPTVYLTVVRGDSFTSCTCPFHKENGVCKHTVAVSLRIAEDAHLAEMEQGFEDWINDRYAYDEHLAEIEMAKTAR